MLDFVFTKSFFYILSVNIILFSLVYLSKQVYSDLRTFSKKISQVFRHNFSVFYIVFFIINFFPESIRLILDSTLICLFFTVGIVNIFLYHKFNSFLNSSFLETVSFTTLSESKEFLLSYFDLKTITILSIFILFSFTFFLIPYNTLFLISDKFHVLYIFKILLFIFCFISIYRKPHKYFIDDFLLYSWFDAIKNLKKNINEYTIELNNLKSELNKEIKNYNITKTKDIEISKIVIIMGESTQRNYMSLYNYSLETTPNLNQLKMQGNLFEFKDVIAPHSHTNQAISKIFTFSNYENQSTPWFKQKNIVNIMKAAGYYTYWISNQESVSTPGNAPEALARLSNKTIFLDKIFTGISLSRDEQIIKELKQIPPKEKEFYILHLQGTHMDYSRRYSNKFKKFNINDLKNNNLDHLNKNKKLTTKQAKIKSHYLNAIYYNDYIINEIINHFKNEETIIFYLSDHGDEVYDFRDFFGHTETIGSRYMAEIPFIIYFSDKLKQKYPNIISQIKKAQNLPFMSDDFLHAFLDIIGLTINGFQKDRSLFSNNFNKERVRIFANKNYDEELKLHNNLEKNKYFFKSPSKIWLHRTNELKKILDFEKKYQGFEVDVHYFSKEKYFDVGHDGEKDSIGLNLKDMLIVALKRDKKTIPLQTKFWIDFKNLNTNNAHESLLVLLNICEETGFNKKNLIIESSNYTLLNIFKNKGFYTSYYLLNIENMELTEELKNKIQEAINSQNFNAISFPYRENIYHFIKESKFKINNQDIEILTWNESKDLLYNMSIKAFFDPQVKIILSGEKGIYR